MCGGGSRGNDNNVIENKINLYKVHSLVAPCTRGGGGRGGFRKRKSGQMKLLLDVRQSEEEEEEEEVCV